METIAVDIDEVLCREHDVILFDGVKDALTTLSKTYNLEIVTARNPQRVANTEAWVQEHLPDIFSRVHFIRSYLGGVVTKGQVCVDIGANYLIDDLEEHCLSAHELGVKALLFSSKNHEKLTTVRCWDDILDFFAKK